MPAIDSPEPLTAAWRLYHVEQGDHFLRMADRAEAIAQATVYAQLAVAHYTAANVRAKPVPRVDVHDWPSARPRQADPSAP